MIAPNRRCARIRLPTQYNLEVLDLPPYLKGMKTWVRPTDAHPSMQTHQVISDILYRHITETKSTAGD